MLGHDVPAFAESGSSLPRIWDSDMLMLLPSGSVGLWRRGGLRRSCMILGSTWFVLYGVLW